MGEKLKLRELQNLIRDDPDLQNINNEEKQEIMKALEDHRELKKTGARASNRAAAQDVQATLERVNSEVRQLLFLPFSLTSHSCRSIILPNALGFTPSCSSLAATSAISCPRSGMQLEIVPSSFDATSKLIPGTWHDSSISGDVIKIRVSCTCLCHTNLICVSCRCS